MSISTRGTGAQKCAIAINRKEVGALYKSNERGG